MKKRKSDKEKNPLAVLSPIYCIITYVCGFGWIDYEGGGGIGEVNKQMYQNGNKIGFFG